MNIKLTAQPATDGAGVKIQRVMPRDFSLLDPFLMIDEIRSSDAADYMAGFPEHPHRGFETITYMIEGALEHRDSLGNSGVVESGGVQWMTAGRGLIHEEMPKLREGQFHGFQVWLNLPADEKMQPGVYRDLSADQIPQLTTEGYRAQVLAGRFVSADQEVVQGPINQARTDPHWFDVALQGTLSLTLNADLNAWVYVCEGELEVQSESINRLNAHEMMRLDGVNLVFKSDSARIQIFAGRPLGEPVVQHGPFVMNTAEQINQAIRDFTQGRLVG